jgi:uncharacterized protein (TIGR02246 family)
MTTPTDPAASAAAFTHRFLQAFEELDLQAFVQAFADDATVFFPHPEPAARFQGRAAIAAQFEHVFAAIRAAATSGPPWHRLDPQELCVQLLAPDTAVVTFHLLNVTRLARRTLVLKRADGGWRIAHLHASNVAPPPG